MLGSKNRPIQLERWACMYGMGWEMRKETGKTGRRESWGALDVRLQG